MSRTLEPPNPGEAVTSFATTHWPGDLEQVSSPLCVCLLNGQGKGQVLDPEAL